MMIEYVIAGKSNIDKIASITAQGQRSINDAVGVFTLVVLFFDWLTLSGRARDLTLGYYLWD